jgi:hypothetical protein
VTILGGAGEYVGTTVTIPEDNGADVRRTDGKATGKDDGDAVPAVIDGKATGKDDGDAVPAVIDGKATGKDDGDAVPAVIDGKATGKDDGDAVRETVGESNDLVPATVLMTPVPDRRDISHILDMTDITQTYQGRYTICTYSTHCIARSLIYSMR